MTSVGKMTDESNDSVTVPRSFQTGQGFPTPGAATEESAEESGYPYPYEVMEPEPVEHSFPTPEVPDRPENREEFEVAIPQYVRYVLKEYDLELEYDRLDVSVDARFKSALGNCGLKEYHTPRMKVSVTHYVDRGYSWERCKETVRHELAHAWQARWLGYTSHGPTFRQKARELDCEHIGRYSGEGEPRYVAHCQACGGVYKRYRDCNRVRNPYSGCSSCGAWGSDVDEIEEDHVWVVFDNTDWHKVMD